MVQRKSGNKKNTPKKDAQKLETTPKTDKACIDGTKPALKDVAEKAHTKYTSDILLGTGGVRKLAADAEKQKKTVGDMLQPIFQPLQPIASFMAEMAKQQQELQDRLKPLQDALKPIEGIAGAMERTMQIQKAMQTPEGIGKLIDGAINMHYSLKFDEVLSIGDRIRKSQELIEQQVELFKTAEDIFKEWQEKEPEKYKDLTLDIIYESVSETNDDTYKELLQELFTAAEKRIAHSKAVKQTAGKLTLAKNSGAVTTLGERLSVITDPKYQDALFTSIKANAGYYRMEKVIEDGKERTNKYIATSINPEFITGLFRAYSISLNSGMPNNGEMEVYIPAFTKELGLDINHRTKEKESNKEIYKTRAEAREAEINSFILDIDNIYGTLPGDSENYKLVSVHSYNLKKETMRIVMPFFQQIFKHETAAEKRAIDAGEKYFYWRDDHLVHSTIANERNKAAVEIVNRIVAGLRQRGTTPDSKLPKNKKKHYKDENLVTYNITVRTLIEICPRLKEKIDKQKGTGNKTVTLQRTFKAMYRIIKGKTDVYKAYRDFQINKISPTMTTLQTKLVITHHGENPEYKKPEMPLVPIPENQ